MPDPPGMWVCTCGYQNVGPICTHCAAPSGREPHRDYGPRWFCWFGHRWSQGPPWDGTRWGCLRCGRREVRHA